MTLKCLVPAKTLHDLVLAITSKWVLNHLVPVMGFHYFPVELSEMNHCTIGKALL